LEPTVAVDLAFAPEKKQGKKKKRKRRFFPSNGLQYSRAIAGKREEHIIKAPNHPQPATHRCDGKKTQEEEKEKLKKRSYRVNK
jgi:hypothetical protein